VGGREQKCLVLLCATGFAVPSGFPRGTCSHTKAHGDTYTTNWERTEHKTARARNTPSPGFLSQTQHSREHDLQPCWHVRRGDETEARTAHRPLTSFTQIRKHTAETGAAENVR